MRSLSFTLFSSPTHSRDCNANARFLLSLPPHLDHTGTDIFTGTFVGLPAQHPPAVFSAAGDDDACTLLPCPPTGQPPDARLPLQFLSGEAPDAAPPADDTTSEETTSGAGALLPAARFEKRRIGAFRSVGSLARREFGQAGDPGPRFG